MKERADIVLAAINARYAHASFGARCLLANLGAMRPRARLEEFDLSVFPRTAAERILAHRPKIVGIGCYIWNVDVVERVVAILKAVSPETKVLLGGPEVSYETDAQPLCAAVDHVLVGEGETLFRATCETLLSGAGAPPRVLRGAPEDPERLALPYEEYDEEDLAHRALYVETSRGCPYRCAYCMSSLDETVRFFPDERIFPAFERLLARGGRVFRFVDRTFNLDVDRAVRTLTFFRERHVPGLALHLEMVPDRLPPALLDAIAACPEGMLQLELGVQTFDEATASRIDRLPDFERIERNLRRLREETGAHLHVDLIAGLPGETLESFAAGFDRLLALRPQEIQVGILKRLRGAPIARLSAAFGMVFSPHPPYEVLRTDALAFDDLQRIGRFARYWNLTVNNGRFPNAAPLIREGAASAFEAFMAWSDWLYAETNSTSLHVMRLAKLLFRFGVEVRGLSPERMGRALWLDHALGNRHDVPGFLKPYAGTAPPSPPRDLPSGAFSRQARHRRSNRQ